MRTTPWLKYVDKGCFPSYDQVQAPKKYDPWFACAGLVHKYFEIPEGSEIRFVVHDRPGKNRVPAKTVKHNSGRSLIFDGDLHTGIYEALELFLRRFRLDKIFYVECEIQ